MYSVSEHKDLLRPSESNFVDYQRVCICDGEDLSVEGVSKGFLNLSNAVSASRVSHDAYFVEA